ncbi:DNA polymerase III subunit alpha, partial [Okeania sp. SIO2B9]|uniref:DNA polymerase III subunit alpha n=1 Tax=Okeania sp. SIO2B9 TaxID=2607782 RepID=UPI00142C24C1
MSFVGLHIHSDYSLLDGASQLPQLIDRAVELGMPAIALTDHGVMYGAIQLIKLCRNKGIKPIIGNEMYVINGEIEKQQRGKKFHQVVLAKNTQGYKNLVKLTTLSHLHGFQGKGIFARPCINKELLEKYHEGLIVTSGCLAGEVPQNIMQGKLDEAKTVAKWYKDLFGEDYYLEIQDHGFPEDRVVNTGIVKIANKLKIKIVATNDSHFISCRDVEAHDALLCINTQKLISEVKRMRYSGTEYLKSAEEMKQLFKDHLENEIIEEAIANTLEVADKVEKYQGILGEPRIPDYPIPPEHNADTYLEELAWEGLLERLKLKQRSEISAVYKERMETELKVLQDKGFSTYFLVVWDYIKYARDENIPVGPGRGSAAGSLVAYSLRITNIDPVHHGLLFERFLNPERKSMPDIDTDFCIENRDAMIDYVTERYGEERVAQIITFNRMTSKAVLKDVGRVLGVSFGEANKMAKLIPVARGKPAKLKVMISDETSSPEFKEAYENNEIQIEDNQAGKVSKISVRQWIDMAIRIEGTNKTFGVHAAGVVISKERLDEIVPLQRNNDGAVITQYHMEDIESLGLLKMDFLGLKNLTIIQNTADLIEQNHHLPLVPDELPANERKAMEILARGNIKKMPEDVKKTYELIKSGDLEGVFQLESSGMVDVVKKLKPTSIEDISSILALYRPGPLDAGLIPKFIDRKHGREKIEYQHPKLEPILQETYGVLCLPKGTLIDQPDGSREAIENIKSGEIILTSDGRKVWQAKVAKQWRSGVREILKITLSSGTVIYAGKNHRFLTPEGDKFAWELESGVKNGNIYGSAVYEKWQVSSNNKRLGKNEAYCSNIPQPENGEKSRESHLQISSLSLTTSSENYISHTNTSSRKNQEFSLEKCTLFKETNFLDRLKAENEENLRENYLQISYFPLATPSENYISHTNTSSRKNQEFSLEKCTLFKETNFLDRLKEENEENLRENYLQISYFPLATPSENYISHTNTSSRKNQEFSLEKGIFFKQTNLSDIRNLEKDTLFKPTNLLDRGKLKNWENLRESYLQISYFTLTTSSENSIYQTDASSRKNLESFLEKGTLFRQTNFLDRKNWGNEENFRENYLEIFPFSLTTPSEDSISQIDTSSRKNLDSSREKATLFKQTNFLDKPQQENQENFRKNHLQIFYFPLTTTSEDSISQIDTFSRKNQKFSREKATLFRQTNFLDRGKSGNGEKSGERHLQISYFPLTTLSENSISQTDTLSRKNQKFSREKATLFRQTNFL